MSPLRALLALVAFGLLAALLYVGVSVMGRGARPPIGETKSVSSDGLRIAYHEHGAGETVVLLASLARPTSDFNELATALAREGYRTLAIESRGIGGSEGGGPLPEPTLHDLAGDVAAVLDASDLPPGERVHLVGHAFGNRVARTTAADHPERVQSVALVAAGGGAPIPLPIQRALLGSCLSFLPRSIHESALRRAFFAARSEIPDYWRVGWTYWGGMAQIAAARATPSEDFWSAGEAPLLVIQADDDTIAPPEDAGFPLRDQFPDRVTLVRVPNAGHALLPEQPAVIEQSLLAFLRRHPTRR